MRDVNMFANELKNRTLMFEFKIIMNRSRSTKNLVSLSNKELVPINRELQEPNIELGVEIC